MQLTSIEKVEAFTRLFEGNLSLVGLRQGRGLLRLTGCSLCQIGLVPLPLCMRQVISLIVVQC